jgi:hypothetical protein
MTYADLRLWLDNVAEQAPARLGDPVLVIVEGGFAVFGERLGPLLLPHSNALGLRDGSLTLYANIEPPPI